MSDIGDYIFSLIPGKKYHLPSGWTNFNCPVCTYMGTTPDKKHRAAYIDDNTKVVILCKNCGFKVGHKVGSRIIAHKLIQYLNWIGVSEKEIQELYLRAYAAEDGVKIVWENTTKSLPEDAKPLAEWSENPPEEFLKVLEYIANRNSNLINWYNFYWSPSKVNNLNKRLIIPIYRNDKIIGYTARAIYSGILPKYFSQLHKDFVFQEDLLYTNRKHIIMVEGPLDAISISGVSLLGNEINEHQITTLKNSGKNIILCPDRDKAGKALVDIAVDNGWKVSLPSWGPGIKDCSDAVAKYGRIPTICAILNAIQPSSLMLRLKLTKWLA